MKSWKYGIVMLAGLGLLLMAGCQCRRYAGTEVVLEPVEVVSGDKVEILWADVHRVGDEYRLHGAMKHRAAGTSPVSAHVDVEVETAGGVRRMQTPAVWVPRRGPGKGPDFVRFEMALEGDLPERPTVRLFAHRDGRACRGAGEI